MRETHHDGTVIVDGVGERSIQLERQIEEKLSTSAR